MKRIFTTLFFIPVFSCLQAQFAHQNIDMLGSFDDLTVQAEPVYGIRYQSCWGYVDSLGNEYALVGAGDGIAIIDSGNCGTIKKARGLAGGADARMPGAD